MERESKLIKQNVKLALYYLQDIKQKDPEGLKLRIGYAKNYLNKALEIIVTFHPQASYKEWVEYSIEKINNYLSGDMADYYKKNNRWVEWVINDLKKVFEQI